MKTSIYIILASFSLHGYFVNVVGDSEVVASDEKTKIDHDKYLNLSHQKSDAITDEGHNTEDLGNDDDDDDLVAETDRSHDSDDDFDNDVNYTDDDIDGDTDDNNNGHDTDDDDDNDDYYYDLEEARLDGSLVEKVRNKDFPVVGWETTRDLSRRSGSRRR